MRKFPDREPTFEEINAGSVVDGCLAVMYPQMGGYGGKCWIMSDGNDADGGQSCFEAAVYHDGEFPFGDMDTGFGTVVYQPRVLHHCSAAQFVRFGEECAKFLKGHE